MRFAMLVAVVGAACLAVPAQAKVFNVGINAFVTGTKETFNCNGGLSPSCFSPFSTEVLASLGFVDLQEGANSLSYGGFYGSGQSNFTIVRSGDYLTGLNLSYGYKSCSGTPPPGCYATYGTAPTFAVTGGVPEPATWALLMLGFGGIGAAMRRRTRVSFA